MFRFFLLSCQQRNACLFQFQVGVTEKTLTACLKGKKTGVTSIGLIKNPHAVDRKLENLHYRVRVGDKSKELFTRLEALKEELGAESKEDPQVDCKPVATSVPAPPQVQNAPAPTAAPPQVQNAPAPTGAASSQSTAQSRPFQFAPPPAPAAPIQSTATQPFQFAFAPPPAAAAPAPLLFQHTPSQFPFGIGPQTDAPPQPRTGQQKAPNPFANWNPSLGGTGANRNGDGVG